MPFDILILDGKRQGHSYSSQVGNSRRGVVIRDKIFEVLMLSVGQD